jgi:hypothetical protein
MIVPSYASLANFAVFAAKWLAKQAIDAVSLAAIYTFLNHFINQFSLIRSTAVRRPDETWIHEHCAIKIVQANGKNYAKYAVERSIR